MVNKDFQLTVQTCSEGFAHNTALVLAFSFISKIPMLQKKKTNLTAPTGTDNDQLAKGHHRYASYVGCPRRLAHA